MGQAIILNIKPESSYPGTGELERNLQLQLFCLFVHLFFQMRSYNVARLVWSSLFKPDGVSNPQLTCLCLSSAEIESIHTITSLCDHSNCFISLKMKFTFIKQLIMPIFSLAMCVLLIFYKVLCFEDARPRKGTRIRIYGLLKMDIQNPLLVHLDSGDANNQKKFKSAYFKQESVIYKTEDECRDTQRHVLYNTQPLGYKGSPE